MVFGIDIGTTSVAGVAVGSDGQVLASTTLAHHADLPTNGMGMVWMNRIRPNSLQRSSPSRPIC